MQENLELVIRKLLLSIDERKTSSRTKNTESNHGTKLSTYENNYLWSFAACFFNANWVLKTLSQPLQLIEILECSFSACFSISSLVKKSCGQNEHGRQVKFLTRARRKFSSFAAFSRFLSVKYNFLGYPFSEGILFEGIIWDCVRDLFSLLLREVLKEVKLVVRLFEDCFTCL